MSDSCTSIAAIGLTLAALATGPLGLAVAQPPAVQPGEVVPRDVRQIYDRGLQFLAASQSQDGTWDGGKPGPAMTQGLENAARADGSWASGGKQGAGVTALALLAFLASGEDANFGIYSGHIRKALRSLIGTQDAKTGYIGPSMYHHGFAMLALAEAYGAVDERNLWPDEKAPRSVGQALELAVRAAITSQKSNPTNAWRYSPGGRDADASVTGAVIIGLLAARNAGIEVPDESIDKAIAYFRSMTDRSGDVFYLNLGIGWPPRRPGSRSPRWPTPWPAARISRNTRRLSATSSSGSKSPRDLSGNTPSTTRRRPSSRGTSTPGRSGTRSSSASSGRRSSPTAASGAGSTRRSPRRCRCSRWR